MFSRVFKSRLRPTLFSRAQPPRGVSGRLNEIFLINAEQRPSPPPPCPGRDLDSVIITGRGHAPSSYRNFHIPHRDNVLSVMKSTTVPLPLPPLPPHPVTLDAPFVAGHLHSRGRISLVVPASLPQYLSLPRQ